MLFPALVVAKLSTSSAPTPFLCRCRNDEFNPHGQLFFTPLIQAMRMIVHFGETLPAELEPEHIIGAGMLVLWCASIYGTLIFTFGIGAATGVCFEL